MSDTPQVTRTYQHHHLDSTRWRVFEPRAGDVVVTTSYKSGTTWAQEIVHRLVFKGDPGAPPTGAISPWVDARFHGDLDEIARGLRSLPHRRFLKSHLALDGLPWYPEVRYLVVGRDPRDVFMSLWNHYGNYTEQIMERLNTKDVWEGPLLEPRGDDPKALWRAWMTRGWFEWESEGWPFWGNLHHTKSYWDWRHLENLLFVHYSDLLADPRGEIRRIAAFVDEPITDAELDAAVEGTSFASMKRAAKAFDELMKQGFQGGSDAFFYKGTNGRWREVLDAEDLALYEETKKRVLPAECARWLERGSLG